MLVAKLFRESLLLLDSGTQSSVWIEKTCFYAEQSAFVKNSEKQRSYKKPRSSCLEWNKIEAYLG